MPQPSLVLREVRRQTDDLALSLRHDLAAGDKLAHSAGVEIIHMKTVAAASVSAFSVPPQITLSESVSWQLRDLDG